jgi:RNA polymerase sigma factor FliA
VITSPNYDGRGEAAGGRVGVAGEDALWQDWRDSRDDSAREALSALYLPYARALAAKCYSRRVHNQFEFDEYLHFAVVGMMESMERFAPDRGVQFKTFCTTRINGAMLNGIEKLSERQQQVALRRRLGKERVESLAGDLNRDPGQRLLQELGQIGIGLALGFILEGTGMVAGEHDSLPDNAYCNIEMKQLRQQVWQLVEQLTDREGQVIRRHYLQEQSFDEIATALELTKGRISQLHRQGLERLRKLIGESGSVNLAL